MTLTTCEFKAVIEIIGVNPFVFIPENIWENIFEQAGKNKGPIPVMGRGEFVSRNNP